MLRTSPAAYIRCACERERGKRRLGVPRREGGEEEGGDEKKRVHSAGEIGRQMCIVPLDGQKGEKQKVGCVGCVCGFERGTRCFGRVRS
jgi:hypothetical protein